MGLFTFPDITNCAVLFGMRCFWRSSW